MIGIGGIYEHDVIIHQTHFIDSDDDEIHTNNIENYWGRAKRRLKEQREHLNSISKVICVSLCGKMILTNLMFSKTF